jgi:hypothetical protein
MAANVGKIADWALYAARPYAPTSPFAPYQQLTDYSAEHCWLRIGTTTFDFIANMDWTAAGQGEFALWFRSFSNEQGHQYFFTIPYEDELFGWAMRVVSQMKGDVPMGIILQGSGMQPIQPERLFAVEGPPPPIAPVWCPVANMVAERHAGPGGQEVWRGSKHFQPGAKLYLESGFWGMGGERVTVVGRHRGSHQYVTMVVRSVWLENWRAHLVYSPHVIRQLWMHWDNSTESKRKAESIAESFNRQHLK